VPASVVRWASFDTRIPRRGEWLISGAARGCNGLQLRRQHQRSAGETSPAGARGRMRRNSEQGPYDRAFRLSARERVATVRHTSISSRGRAARPMSWNAPPPPRNRPGHTRAAPWGWRTRSPSVARRGAPPRSSDLRCRPAPDRPHRRARPRAPQPTARAARPRGGAEIGGEPSCKSACVNRNPPS
jgi:hypothetical protein